ncbi:hypothetical protein BV25DRAFT_1585851 [Artomyces pyxidatus]|uniref:Uncharacterized protein n=1 Tax=Artomyces pyxidatus TaxID=48021 RepID=A0ACB8TAV4_9AGAM|nr:hypothetical protein BV25DRAFT_1585851 [Artomyces pyxidatus]
MALTVSATEIIAFCLESVFYGIYLSLFGASVAVLHRKRAQSNLNIRLLAVSCTLFVLITSHEFVDAIRLLLSFQRNQTTSGADLFYKSVADTFSIALNSIYLIETLLSDLFMLYRCYVVWGSSWSIVMLPCLLFIAAGVTGVSTICTLKAFGDVMLFNNRLETMANSFFSCTLALNGICTGLIAFRILCTQFQNRDLAVSPYLTRVAIVIVESGAIYLASLVVLVATFSAKTIAFLIPLSAVSLSIKISRLGKLTTLPFRPLLSLG